LLFLFLPLYSRKEQEELVLTRLLVAPTFDLTFDLAASVESPSSAAAAISLQQELRRLAAAAGLTTGLQLP
jgi:hypothetical protein